jgi:hypothetical protein
VIQTFADQRADLVPIFKGRICPTRDASTLGRDAFESVLPPAEIQLREMPNSRNPRFDPVNTKNSVCPPIRTFQVVAVRLREPQPSWPRAVQHLQLVP